ncbi:MAG: hypothetical protein ABJC89_14110, partial [Acidobacteriota bacterium]
TERRSRSLAARSRGDRSGSGPVRRPAAPPVSATAIVSRPPAREEVLIDPARRDAVDRLLAMVRSGATNLPATAPDSSQPIAPADLAVTPVLVERLDVPLLSLERGRN